MRLMIFILTVFFINAAIAQTSDYRDHTTRDIKALSADDVDALRNGKGMGLAKAAELNHFPGPKHVMDLAEKLELSDDQVEQSKQLFLQMQTAAQKLGNELIEKESELDLAFAAANIDQRLLETLTTDIGALQGRLRAVHLQAHLKQRALLSDVQIARYDELRGYSQLEPNSSNSHQQHQHHAH